MEKDYKRKYESLISSISLLLTSIDELDKTSIKNILNKWVNEE